MTEATRERVDHGMLLLDKTFPHWEHHVNLDKLDMGTLDQCVLGQLFGDYLDGLLVLPIIYPNEGGFSADILEEETNYKELTELWKEKILERRIV